jgi:replication-associated recombination protein RarA
MEGENRPSELEYEYVSAMQKSIRRGLAEEAGRFFFAMAEGKWFYWALSRLKVVAHEDVGTADMQAAMFALRACDDAKDWYAKKNGAWRLAASNAILALARAAKGRQSDHFQAAMRGRNAKSPPAVPDWALDKHTRKGKELGRGFEHFKTVGSVLVGEKEPDPWRDEAFATWESGVLDGPPPMPGQGALF